MKLSYPPRLRLAQTPTPFYALERLSAEVGGPRIWIKRDDMTGCGISGNKVRKLEFTLALAIEQGYDTVITVGGVQSNHCRATALLCARLGLKCHLILRGDAKAPVDGNLLLDHLAGAAISFYSNSEYNRRRDDIFAELEAQYTDRGHRAYSIPIGASDGHGLWGYIAASEELQQDCRREGIAPGHILAATGSGGTQGGLTAGAAVFDLGAKVWGINVCDDEQYFLDKVGQDLAQWRAWYPDSIDPSLNVETLPIRVIEGYVGPGYGRAGPEIFTLIQRIAALEGILLDPVYTAKAFYGMLEEIRCGRFDDSDDIVFVHTGGVFGLFPQRDQLPIS